MYRIAREFRFSASHQLHQLPEGHKCKRLHGHNYVLTLFFQRADLDQWDFVRDFDSLSTFQNWVDVQLDHRHLNDVLHDRREESTKDAIRKASSGDVAPTSENIARWIFDRWGGPTGVWPDLVAVRVSEGLETWAEYSN